MAGGSRQAWPALLLVALTAAAYAPVRRAGFINYDDTDYVVENRHVSGGLTPANVVWAFTTFAASNWHPLTWLSHQADSQLYGLNPAGHHLTSVALHAVNAVLVWGVLFALTGARWRSALVAALFAVHPLNVESVAWVAERKNVLSTLFWLAGMWAYARYARQPSPRRYAWVAFFLVLGLMSKPMVVTLPFVLLLLDWWPLGRWRPELPDAGRRALELGREKLPLLALAAAGCLLTVLAQQRGGAVNTLRQFTMGQRLANAPVSYVAYLGAMVRPVDLAVFYPHPAPRLELGTALLAIAVLAALTALAWRLRQVAAVPVGWLWYLGTLVPVIGIVQVGAQARADRYAYVPLLGIFIALVWGLEALARRGTPWLAGAAMAAILALLGLTRAQVRRWESTVTLLSHALQVTDGNFIAHTNLGAVRFRQGDLAAAERHYREAVRIQPAFWVSRAGLGMTLERQGRLAEALEQQREALRLSPSSAETHRSLAALEARLGHPAVAEAHYAEAVRLDPSLAAAHFGWGNLLGAAGRWAEAEARMATVVRLEPDNVEALDCLGQTLSFQGRWAEAARTLARAVALDPQHVRAHVDLGFALRELGQLEEARTHWQRAVLLSRPGDPVAQEAREALARLPPPGSSR